MAVGDITYNNSVIGTIQLLAAQATANNPPALATDGADITKLFAARANAAGTLLIKGTGTGTVAGTFRLWGYNPVVGEWFPLGTGTDSSKGVINAGTAIGEVKTDKVLHAEPVLYAGHFTRLYVELQSPSGTAPAFDAYFVAPRVRP